MAAFKLDSAPSISARHEKLILATVTNGVNSNFLADVVGMCNKFCVISAYPTKFRLILPEITVIRVRFSHARREGQALAELLSNT